MKRHFVSFIAVVMMAAPTPAFAKKKLVVYWNFDASRQRFEHLNKVISEFERRHDVSVSLVTRTIHSTDDLHDAYLKILSSGSKAPDLIQIDGIRIPEFAALNYIIDVTKYFPKGEKDQFLSNSIEEVTWNGRIWGFPLSAATGIIAYREDILSKHGIRPPETWQELIDAAIKLQRIEGLYGYVGQMANYEGLVCNALEFIWSNGGNPGFEPPLNLTSPNIVGGLDLMVDLASRAGITPEQQLRFKENEGFQLFMDGRAIFTRQWAGDWLHPDFDEYNRAPEVEIGVIPLPRGPSGARGAATSGGWALAINKNSDNVALATELARLITNEKNQKLNMLRWSYMPSRKILYKDEDILKLHPWVGKIYSIVIGAKLRPRSQFYPELSAIMQNEFHLALEGKISPKLAMERIEKKIGAFLKSVAKTNVERK